MLISSMRRAGLEAHVFVGALEALAVGFAARVGEWGTVASMVVTMPGEVPQVTAGASVAASMWSSRSKVAPSSVGSVRPVRDGLVPCCALRREAAAFEVGEGGLVGGDHAGARACFDAHVADRHAAFHGEGADGGAGVLDDVAGGAGGADRPMMSRMMSLAVTPKGRSPSTVMRKVLGLSCGSVCVAMTCSTSLVPMPKASAPKAPWVEVCESPQTMVMPGLVAPSSGPIMWTMPWSAILHVEELDAELGAVLAQRVRSGARRSGRR